LRTVAIFDSGLYRNANAVTFHTVPGEDGGNPKEWRTKAQEQLTKRYPDTCSFIKSRVVDLKSIKPVHSHHTTRFAARDDQGKTYEARKVVLAMGVEDKLTDIKGGQ
jgi:thioredoxin reductase